ncbi:MAG: membrane protein insertion efficiency factor YidD [Planctomycetota bacterium]|nr:membrane protein insertion efficiency factor YidD [Planctomycetota bacterium]
MTRDRATVLTAVCTALIRAYQRWISPRKGWRCAHAAVNGGPSCSAFALQALRENAMHDAVAAVRSRFRACARAVEQADGAEADETDGTSKPRRRKRRWRRRRRDPDVDDLDLACVLPCETIHCCALGPWP